MDSIKLTLDPEQPDVIDAEATSLVLTDEEGVIGEVQETPESICDLLERDLTPDQIATVDSFYPKINLRDNNLIDQYALPTQKKLNAFTQQITEKAQAQDLGIVGLALASLPKAWKSMTPPPLTSPSPPTRNLSPLRLRDFSATPERLSPRHIRKLWLNPEQDSTLLNSSW
jgi:uncharacterized protein YaaN involved in tellurite resistance